MKILGFASLFLLASSVSVDLDGNNKMVAFAADGDNAAAAANTTPAPAAETPAEPAAETPAEPAAETPAEPAAETPVEPAADATTPEPAAETPAEPAADATTPEPAAETPAEPAADATTPEPAAETPAEPAADTTTSAPDAETPANPDAETPAKSAAEDTSKDTPQTTASSTPAADDKATSKENENTSAKEGDNAAAKESNTAEVQNNGGNQSDYSTPCDNEGETLCASDAKNKYWMCAKGKWTILTCDGDTICGQSADNKAVCHDKDKPLETPEDKTDYSTPCDNEGETLCASDAKNKYWMCAKGKWTILTCDGDTICGQSADNKAVCHDKDKPLETPEDKTDYSEPCDNEGETLCASDAKNKYWMCAKGKWTMLTCDGDTICGQSADNKAVCHDKDKPLETPEDKTDYSEPCDNEGETLCASDAKNKYWMCAKGKWTMLTCDGDTICGQSSGNKAVCHDKDKPLETPEDKTDYSEPCDNEGETLCASDAKNKYWMCAKGKWTMLTCDGDTICGQSSGNKAVCHDKDKPLETPEDTSDYSEPCDNEGESKCASDAKNKYWMCAKGKWTMLTCDGDTICGQSDDNKAVCHDKDKPLETPKTRVSCSKKGTSMCDETDPHKYFMCTGEYWENMSCEDDNYCIVRNNKTSCVDKATAEAPVLYCEKDKASQCSPDNKKVYMICTDGYWQNSTCSDDNYCLFRGGKTECVDKATSEAPVLTCDKEKASQCAPDNKKIYQICTNGYWQNSTCSDDNYCLFRGGKTTCVDKATSEAPVLPCKTAKASQCAPDNKKIYQICIDGYWQNSTCSDDNYCLFRGGKTTCVDKATSEAPVLPCKKAKASQCAPDNKKIYQICIDGYWQNSTCSDDNYCLFRGGKTTCVDKATSEAPVLPCNKAKSSKCSPDNKKVYMICTDGYWQNSTCSDDNYCLFRGNQTVCVDKATSEAPVLPCKTPKASKCSPDNKNVYMVCTEGYWQNSTCSDDNVCRMKNNKTMCVDKDAPEDPDYSSVEPGVFTPEEYEGSASIYTIGSGILLFATTGILSLLL